MGNFKYLSDQFCLSNAFSNFFPLDIWGERHSLTFVGPLIQFQTLVQFLLPRRRIELLYGTATTK
jgi:hypothetical protein